MTRNSRSVVLALAGLALLGSALLFPRLGASALWDPWEPKYAQSAREMADRGDWIVPYYRHEPRLVKPPLTYWLIGASHAVFGETEAAARLPSALLALVAPLALCLALALRGRVLEGFLAGAALLTSPEWLLLGRFATPDMPFAAIGALLLAAAIALPALGRRGRLACGLAVVVLLAAATLTEWPRGLVLPAWALVGYGAVRDGWRGALALMIAGTIYAVGQHLYIAPLTLVSFALVAAVALRGVRLWTGVRWSRLLGAAVLVAALAAPWFVAAWAAEPAETSERLFGYKHALNLGETPGEHEGPLHYPFSIVVVGALPWLAAASVGLRRGTRGRSDDVARAFAGCAIGVLLFYTLSEAQMGHFYGAIQPAVAGLAGVGAAALVRRRDASIVGVVVTGVAASLLVSVRPTWLIEGANVFSDLHGRNPLPLAWGTLTAWMLLVLLGWWRRRAGWLVLAVLPGAVLAADLAQRVVPDLAWAKSTGAIWRRYKDESRPGEPLGAWGWNKDSIFYYSDNRIADLEALPELLTFLEGQGDRYLVVPHEELDALRRALPREALWGRVEDDHPSLALVRYRAPATADATSSGQ